MIKTRKIHRKGFYIFESRVAANSNYIENIHEAKLLLVYARYYLKSYIMIHDYVITRHGWQFAVTLDKKRITEKDVGDSEVWKLISERIRLFLSTYVRRVNKGRNRSGVLVRNNYSKYYFETLEEALGHLDKMRNQKVRLYQKRKKYRGIKYHYRIDKQLGRGSIYLCSKELRSGKGKGEDLFDCESIWDFGHVVGPKMINFTLLKHTTTQKRKTTQNSS